MQIIDVNEDANNAIVGGFNKGLQLSIDSISKRQAEKRKQRQDLIQQGYKPTNDVGLIEQGEAIQVGGQAYELPITKKAQNIEAKAKFEAFVKNQKGLPLSDVEKGILGIEDNSKPSEFDIWKQAKNETAQQLGFNDMQGFNEEAQQKFYPNIKSRFLELKKEMGLEDNESRIERAKFFLKQNGYVGTNETATMFLQENANF